MIRASGLEKRFSSGDRSVVHAVRDVSLDVKPGNIFCLLGPNGAGKSTTILMLVTLVRPSAGRAIVAGHDVVAEAAAVRRRVGIALQDVGLDVLQTGRELLRLHGRLHGLRPRVADARASELIEAFELADVADRRVGTYSGGLKRRLDLALAIVHDPAVVFVDEPTAGLDPGSRRALFEQLRALREAGKTILLTTQYLEEADAVADEIAVMDGGVLVAEGTPREVKARLGNDIIELELADASEATRVHALVAARSYVEGARVRIGIDDGAARVPALLERLRAEGIEPRAFSVSDPTLDDVFLWLTRNGARRGEAPAPNVTMAGKAP